MKDPLRYIKQQTTLARQTFSDCHAELLTFLIYSSKSQPLILGYPWLKQHNPRINWTTGEIMAWAESCCGHCLPAGTLTQPTTTLLAAMSVESEFPDLSKVPSCYIDPVLQGVGSVPLP